MYVFSAQRCSHEWRYLWLQSGAFTLNVAYGGIVVAVIAISATLQAGAVANQAKLNRAS